MKTTGNWMSTEPRDMKGRELKPGQKVARAITSGRACNIAISEVTRIEGDNVYLDGSKIALNYPGRLLILEGFP